MNILNLSQVERSDRIELRTTLFRRRKVLNLTQSDVAYASSITVTAYAMIERGEMWASLHVLIRVLKVLYPDFRYSFSGGVYLFDGVTMKGQGNVEP